MRNKRLADACHWWAFNAITRSPGARAHYDRRRASGDYHNAALQNLANKLIGRLWWCLVHDQPWDENTAWPSADTAQNSAPLDNSLTWDVYVATWSGLAYVAFVTDVISRRIVRWNVAATLKAEILPLQALDMAAWDAGGDLAGLTHHSDHGSNGGFKEPAQHLLSEVDTTVSWDDRCIAYSMLLEGASAQETARHFRVNTGAVVEWARLAGMVIRMGAGVASNPSRPRRVFPMTGSSSRWRSIGCPPGRCEGSPAILERRHQRCPGRVGRHQVETGRGRRPSRESRYHAGVAHHHSMQSRRRSRPSKLDAGRHLRACEPVTGLHAEGWLGFKYEGERRTRSCG